MLVFPWGLKVPLALQCRMLNNAEGTMVQGSYDMVVFLRVSLCRAFGSYTHSKGTMSRTLVILQKLLNLTISESLMLHVLCAQTPTKYTISLQRHVPSLVRKCSLGSPCLSECDH